MKLRTSAFFWMPLACALGCSGGTETANNGAQSDGSTSLPPPIEKSKPCTTSTPPELYIATSEQSSDAAKLKTFEKFWPKDKGTQGRAKELLATLSAAKGETKEVESELSDIRDRFQTMSNTGGSSAQKLNEIARLKERVSNLSQKRDQLKAAETRATRAYSVGVGTSRAFPILNRNLDIYVVSPDQQKPGKWRFLTLSDPAGNAIVRILTDEYHWKAKTTGTTTYKQGFTVRLIDKPSPNAIGIQLNASGNEAYILAGEFFEPIEVETASAKISAKIKVHLEFSSSRFDDYDSQTKNLTPDDEQKWIVKNKFAFVKYSLLHEVAHSLGMIHELQRQHKTDTLYRWKDLKDSCKQLFQFTVEADFYNDQIYVEEDLCASYIPISDIATGNVCRASGLDLSSIMMYWLPKCVFTQWTCEKNSGCVSTTGTRTPGFFFGPDEDHPPLNGHWLPDDDRAFFEQYN